MKATGERRKSILLAYVVATGGRLPVPPLDELLRAVREKVPDITREELADALRWAIRESKRKEAKLEATLRERERWRTTMTDNIINLNERIERGR